MEEVSFTVLGEPTGKGRPRFVTRYNAKTGRAFGQAHTPEKTVVYENLVKISYMEQTNNYRFSDDSMISMDIVAYYSIPKSAAKKKKVLMEAGEIRPTKKPDMDNIMKIIADSLNNLAYHDDSAIVEAHIDKYYSNEPRVEVTIRQVNNELCKEE